MRDLEVKDLLSKAILFLTGLMPFSILPNSALDSINTPQLTVLITIGFIIFGLLIAGKDSISWRENRTIVTLLVIFNCMTLISAVASKGNLISQFYGASGRHTGLLTYLILSVIMFAAVILSNGVFIEGYLKILIGIGIVSTSYGLIQNFGFDPIDWNNTFSPVIGFLGNPNFHSALLSITGVPIFAGILLNRRSIKIQSIFLLTFILLLFTIYQTDSRQGIFSLAAGTGFILASWLYGSKKKKFLTILVVAAIFIATFIVAGIFKIGPFAEILYRRSNSARFYYWEAAWKMTTEHPFLGIGLDNYGDWYRRARSISSVETFGPDSVSDVAHNVFLEFSASGGFPLLTIYCGITTLGIISIVRVIRRQKEFSIRYSALAGAWIAYQLQSLVSINQLSLVLLGWTLTGLLVGYDLSEDSEQKLAKVKVRKKIKKEMHPKFVLILLISGLFGFSIGAQPMIASIKFRESISSGDLQGVYKNANLFPNQSFRLYQISSILRENELELEALEVIEFGLERFPNYFPLWRLLSQTEGLSEPELESITSKLKSLDPYGG